MKERERKWQFEIYGSKDAPSSGGCLSLGNFDGFHRGHAHLIENLRREAGDLSTSVLTFFPHPAAVIGNERIPLLCSLERRVELLLNAGVDAVIVQQFTSQFASLDARAFCSEYLAGCFRFSKIVLGFDYRFGRGRAGDAALLADAGVSFGWSVAKGEPLLKGSVPVSSSRVRERLFEGDVSGANELLGRLFSLEGVVVKGDQRGRTLGFPTLNLRVSDARLVPKAGVYAGLVRLTRTGEVFQSVMSLGLRPTFGDYLEFRIEGHVFDFARDVYGEEVEFHFFSRLRDEKKFSDVEALRAQMNQDAAQARAILASASL